MKIQLKNVHHSYGNRPVLQDISLELDGVRSVGIIGASGCGKSTLLRLMAGIEAPDSGEIALNGLSSVSDKEELQNQIGYVFQSHNLFPHLSLRDNILLILEKIRKMPRHEAEIRADEALDQVHLGDERYKRPSQVSGGQGQRGSIARALATDPQLILLDEPTAALDPRLTDEVLKTLLELREQGRECIFVTHEMDFLQEFCDYVIYMEDGKIIETGDVSCLEQPKTEGLKHFLHRL